MSLSAEALGKLEGLDLQRVRTGLDFAPTVESRRPVLADLSADGMREFRNWDLSGVLAGLNSLTFEAMHPELVAAPVSMPEADDELPDWLKSTEEAAPPVEAEEVFEPAPFQEEPTPGGSTEEEARAGLQAAEAVGAGTQVIDDGKAVIPPARESYRREAPISVDGMKKAFRNYLSTWLDRNKLSLAAEFTGGTAAGFLTNLCFTELVAKNPQMASFLPSVLTSLQGPTIISTNLMEAGTIGLLNFRGKSGLAEKYMRASSYAERIAVSYTADSSVDRFLLMSLTVPKTMRDAVIRPGTTGFTAGTWLYAALAGAGVFGEDHQLINGADAVAQPVSAGGGEGLVDHPRPVDASIGQAGGLPPDVQPPADVATANEATQAAQAVAQQAEAAEQAAEQAAIIAAQAAEAARIAALQQGPTVAELAAQMPKQTVSEAIYQMIGDVPHRGEVTNVLFRAIGDKVNSLNEGAIKAAAEALRPVFENIDKVMADSGTAYTEGGRAVVEAMSGFNSPEAQAIRAANMGDLEAAGNLLNNVIGPVIR